RQSLGHPGIERRKPRLLAVTVTADRQFARDPRVGRRRPDLGFAVRRAPRRLRLPGRQAELRSHPAAEFLRGDVLRRWTRRLRRHGAACAPLRECLLRRTATISATIEIAISSG